MTEYDDDNLDEPRRPMTEGVRIIGAEEVVAMGDAAVDDAAVDDADARDPATEGRLFPGGSAFPGGVSYRPQPPEAPAVRLLPADEPAESESLEAPELPHWSEPPAGDVPVFVSEPVDEYASLSTQESDEADGEADANADADVWSSITGSQPRYRDHASDWAEADFIPGESLVSEETAVGALAEHVDEEEEFTDAVAQRRGGLRRGKQPGLPSRKADRPARLEPDYPIAQPADSATQGRDLPIAIATGVAFVVVALFIFNLGRGPTAWLAGFIVMVATAEVYAEARSNGYQPATLLGLIGSISLTLGAYWKGESAYPIVIALVVAFTPLWYLSRVVHARATVNMALTLFGFGYVGVLGSFSGLLLAYPNGIGLLIGVALCVVAHDIGAFFIGSRIGTKKIAPRVSPNKTIEGLLGGCSASLLVGLAVASQITPWDAGSGLWLGLTVAVTAPLGDLCQSMLKRDLGVKDIGGLLPGHGGMLDRFDSLFLSLPAIYYLVRILEL